MDILYIRRTPLKKRNVPKPFRDVSRQIDACKSFVVRTLPVYAVYSRRILVFHPKPGEKHDGSDCKHDDRHREQTAMSAFRLAFFYLIGIFAIKDENLVFSILYLLYSSILL